MTQDEVLEDALRKGREQERDRILSMLQAHIDFHARAAEDGEREGVDMGAISGGVAALRWFQRAIIS